MGQGLICALWIYAMNPSVGYGNNTRAVHIPEDKIDEKIDEVSSGRKVVIYWPQEEYLVLSVPEG